MIILINENIIKDGYEFMGYHSSRHRIEGFKEGADLDIDQYEELGRNIWNEYLGDIGSDIDWDDDDDVIRAFDSMNERYHFLFVSRNPIEASSFQTSKYKYGDNLYKVYAKKGSYLLADDPNELEAEIIIQKRGIPLYFEKVEGIDESLLIEVKEKGFFRNMNVFRDISDEDMDKIYEADPSKSKSYVWWLLMIYKMGNLRLEDLYKATEYLEVYERMKAKDKGARSEEDKIVKPEHRDLNRTIKKTVKQNYRGKEQEVVIKVPVINSLQQLFTIIKPYVDNKSIETPSELKKRNFLIRAGKWDVYQVKDYESSCALGSGTQWCTATGKTRKHYDNYTMGFKKGNLYILINRNNNKDKYQLWVSSEQGDRWNYELSDKNDTYFDAEDFLYKNPDAYSFFMSVLGNKEYLHNIKNIIGKQIANLRTSEGEDVKDYVVDWMDKINVVYENFRSKKKELPAYIFSNRIIYAINYDNLRVFKYTYPRTKQVVITLFDLITEVDNIGDMMPINKYKYKGRDVWVIRDGVYGEDITLFENVAFKKNEKNDRLVYIRDGNQYYKYNFMSDSKKEIYKDKIRFALSFLKDKNLKIADYSLD
jgi:hypothetical protein